MTIIRAQRTPATPSAGPTLTQTGPAAVNVTWTMPEGASTVILKRGSTTLYTGALLTYDDTTVTYPNTYGYTTQGISTGGFPGAVSPTASITISDVTAPSVPAITVTAISSGTINVTLSTASTDAGSGVLNYDVERSLNGSTGWAAISSSPFTSLTTWPDTGLSASTAYYYRARARDVAGNVSAYSTVVNSTTQAAAGGGLAHGDLYTVTGSGFGTKSGSAPTMWDYGQAAAGTLLTGWKVYGTQTPNAFYRTYNRTAPFTGASTSIAAPHQFSSRFIAGCHGDGAYSGFPDLNSDTGLLMALWTTYAPPAADYYIYWCYYTRNAPEWTFTNSGTADYNYKFYGHSYGQDIYDVSPGGINDHYYLNWQPNQYVSNTAGGSASMNDDHQWVGIQNPDINGNNSVYQGVGTLLNPSNAANGWIRCEVETRLTAATGAGGGYLKYYENGQLRFNYGGRTDGYPAGNRSNGIGGYSRMAGFPTNWRFYADVYMDRQIGNGGRFMLTNNATFTSSTIIEPQPWSGSWTDSAVTLQCNRGKLPAGVAHLHYRSQVNYSTSAHQYLGTKTLA